jgi:hypothetical protein
MGVIRTDRAYDGQRFPLLAVGGAGRVVAFASDQLIATEVAGVIVAQTPPITWAHVVVPVLPAGIVTSGQFAIASIESIVEDEFLITVQHTDVDAVHLFLLNLSRASGVFNDPVTFAIFSREAP